MAKRKKKDKHWAKIYSEILNDPVFLAFPISTRYAYVLLVSHIYNPGQREIKFSYAEAEKHMSSRTFSRAIAKLEDTGFIRTTQRGGLFGKPNKYIISDEWRTPFKDTGMV